MVADLRFASKRATELSDAMFVERWATETLSALETNALRVVRSAR